MICPSVVSEAIAEEELVASSESARSLLIQRLEGSRPAVRSGCGGYGFSMGVDGWYEVGDGTVRLVEESSMAWRRCWK